jgi:hypothetical protein
MVVLAAALLGIAILVVSQRMAVGSKKTQESKQEAKKRNV